MRRETGKNKTEENSINSREVHKSLEVLLYFRKNSFFRKRRIEKIFRERMLRRRDVSTEPENQSHYSLIIRLENMDFNLIRSV
jgi:hypothetical protein